MRDDAASVEKYERWWDAVVPFQVWLSRYKVEYIASQQYVVNRTENYQGRLDLKINILEVPSTERRIKPGITLIDFKRTVSMPEGTRYQLAGYKLADQPRAATAEQNWQREYAHIQRIGMQLMPGKCIPHVYDNYGDYDTFRLWARTYRSLQEYR